MSGVGRILSLLFLLLSSASVPASSSTLLPLFYDVELNPVLKLDNPSDLKLITRTVIFGRVVADNSDRFRLFSNAKIEKQAVTAKPLSKSWTAITIKSFARNNKSGAYDVVLSERLEINTTVMVTIARAEEAITNNSRSSSLVYSVYNGSNGNKELIIHSPNVGKVMFPCIDKYNLTAKISLAVSRPKDFIVYTGLQPDAIDESDERAEATEKFNTSAVMGANMVSLALLKLRKRCFFVSRGREICLPDRENEQLMLMAIRKVSKAFLIVDRVEDILGVNFPVRKVEIVFFPGDTDSVYESACGVLYLSEKSIWINGTELYWVDLLARNWFGCLTGPATLPDMWLFSVVGSYLRIQAIQDIVNEEPERPLMLGQVEWSRLSVLNLPAIAELRDEGQINAYEAISIIRQIIYWIGEKPLLDTLKQLLTSNKRRSFGNAEFLESLRVKGASEIHIAALRKLFQLPGVPLVQCSLSNGRLRLTQSRFAVSSSNESAAAASPWMLPITMVTSDNVTSRDNKEVSGLIQWMTQEEQAFPYSSSSSWYLLNALSAGNYRVNYDDNNWDALLAQFNSNSSVFTWQEKIRIVDDSFSLAEVGLLDFAIPMSLAKFLLKNEKDPDVMYIVWRHLSMLHEYLKRYGTQRLLARFTCERRSSLQRLVNTFEKAITPFRLLKAKMYLKTVNDLCPPNEIFLYQSVRELGEAVTQDLHNWLTDNITD